MSCRSYTASGGHTVTVGDSFHEIDGRDWRVEAIQFDSAGAAHAVCVSDSAGEPRVIAVAALLGCDFYRTEADHA